MQEAGHISEAVPSLGIAQMIADVSVAGLQLYKVTDYVWYQQQVSTVYNSQSILSSDTLSLPTEVHSESTWFRMLWTQIFNNNKSII